MNTKAKLIPYPQRASQWTFADQAEYVVGTAHAAKFGKTLEELDEELMAQKMPPASSYMQREMEEAYAKKHGLPSRLERYEAMAKTCPCPAHAALAALERARTKK
jgi:hypothetical protein